MKTKSKPRKKPKATINLAVALEQFRKRREKNVIHMIDCLYCYEPAKKLPSDTFTANRLICNDVPYVCDQCAVLKAHGFDLTKANV